MAATTKITLSCDYRGYGFEDSGDCEDMTETTAVLFGANLEKPRLDVQTPDGWWIGHVSEGYGYGPPKEIKCACPKHAAKMRGY